MTRLIDHDLSGLVIVCSEQILQSQVFYRVLSGLFIVVSSDDSDTGYIEVKSGTIVGRSVGSYHSCVQITLTK